MIDSVEPTDEMVFHYLLESRVHSNGWGCENISEQFNSFDLTINGETHTVDVVYNYDPAIKEKLSNIAEELPKPLEIKDLDLVDYWVNSSDDIINYSTELNALLKKYDLEVTFDVRTGDVNLYHGILVLKNDYIIYYVNCIYTINVLLEIHVPSDTADDKILETAQKRIDEHVGNDKVVLSATNQNEVYEVKVGDKSYFVNIHVFNNEVEDEKYLASEATCVEAAKYYKSCDCLEKGTETFSVGEPKGHNWNQGEITVQPTTEKEGVKTYTCSICKETKTETLAKLEKGETTVIETKPATPSTPKTVISKVDVMKDLPLSNEEITAIETGKDLNVFIEVNDEKVTEENKNVVKSSNELKDYTIGHFIEIDLCKQISGDSTKTAINETNNGIELTISVPETLINNDQTVKREYKVARLHNDEVTLLDATFKDGQLAFTTNKFSTYAIVYVDTPLTLTSTADFAPVQCFLGVSVVSFIGIGGLACKKRKFSI